MPVTFGVDRLIQNPEKYLRGKRFGMLVNQSSVTRNGRYSFEALMQGGFNPDKIFAPEHGLFAIEQDQISVAHERDPFTGLKAISLYGQTKEELKPRANDLDDIDILIVDIQDIGCRYYTYAYTMAFCVEACAELGIEVIVCDRPNPLGGLIIEGPIVQPGFESFVGAYPLAARHSLTIGEIALYLNAREKWQANLTIIELEGWRRSMTYAETGGLWVQPSPNMPTLDTVLVYPGTCLFEATNMSEGRGTTRPFEIIGAPFVDAKEYAAALNSAQLPGVYFRPLYFKPTFHKHQDKPCGGVFVHVTDPEKFESYTTGLVMVKTAHDLYPNKFQWRTEPYEYVSAILAIDLLTGSAEFRETVAANKNLETYLQCCRAEADEFRNSAITSMIYEYSADVAGHGNTKINQRKQNK